jgi:hypothetical protein
MSQEDYLRDISEIKNLMSKSSKFISLSGLSGILAGIYALIGSGYAYWLVNNSENGYLILEGETLQLVLIDLILVGILSIGTAIILTTKKAKQNDEKIWDPLTRRLLLNFLIPLTAGGIYILIILIEQHYEQVGNLMLLFYGLALFNASKYTLGDVKYLGLTQITLGLLSAIFPGYGFWFWAIGFGIMHILYGLVMYFKYDKN